MMTEGQKMEEEGKHIFSIFAARMFEQRVLQAFRERVAWERQSQLLRELEDEDERQHKKQSQKKKKKKDKNRQPSASSPELTPNETQVKRPTTANTARAPITALPSYDTVKRYLESRGDIRSGGGLYEQTLSAPILPIQIGPIMDSFASALKKLQVDSGKQNDIKESAKNFLLSNKKRKNFEQLVKAAVRHLGTVPHLWQKLNSLNLILSPIKCRIVAVHEQRDTSFESSMPWK
ncbi:hypothetical protein C8J57DRAFT_670655 [Mycena rebaudengoi]|nr:hypothetical protein C8J57DRAFT_670655 [Mycena rebaudengoi]